MKKLIVVAIAALGLGWALQTMWPGLHSTAFMVNTFSVEWILVIALGTGMVFGTWVFSRKGR
jgi:hypothetical protein